MARTNPKFQIPNPNPLPSPKSQRTWTLGVHWDLDVGSSLGFGTWSLGFEKLARRHLREHLFHDRIRTDLVGLTLEVEQQAVAERGKRRAADVVDRDERLAPDECVDFRREHQRLGGARAGAVSHVTVHQRGRVL